MIVTQPSKYCEHLFHNISSSKLWLEGLDVVPAATDAGASVSIKKITLDKNLEKALYQLKKVLKVPINILFQTAWGILLNRFSGTNNIFYGIQFSGNERILPMRSKLREVDVILTYIVKLYKQQKKNKKHADEILTKLDNQEKYKKSAALYYSFS